MKSFSALILLTVLTLASCKPQSTAQTQDSSSDNSAATIATNGDSNSQDSNTPVENNGEFSPGELRIQDQDGDGIISLPETFRAYVYATATDPNIVTGNAGLGYKGKFYENQSIPIGKLEDTQGSSNYSPSYISISEIQVEANPDDTSDYHIYLKYDSSNVENTLAEQMLSRSLRLSNVGDEHRHLDNYTAFLDSADGVIYSNHGGVYDMMGYTSENYLKKHNPEAAYQWYQEIQYAIN